MGESLLDLGDFTAARATIEEGMAAADLIGSTRIKAANQVIEMYISLYQGGQSDWSERALTMTNDLIPVLKHQDAHSELASVWRIVVLAHGMVGRFSLADEAVAQSNHHARLSGNRWVIEKNGVQLTELAVRGHASARRLPGARHCWMTGQMTGIASARSFALWRNCSL